MTQTGAVIGTPFYMSPEQVKGEPVGPQSDIFALGVILYQMAAGAVPFGGATPFEVMVARTQRAPKPIKELNPELPAVPAEDHRALPRGRPRPAVSERAARSSRTWTPSRFERPSATGRCRSGGSAPPIAATGAALIVAAAGPLGVSEGPLRQARGSAEDAVRARRRLREPHGRPRLRRHARARVHARARGRALRQFLQPQLGAQGRAPSSRPARPASTRRWPSSWRSARGSTS